MHRQLPTSERLQPENMRRVDDSMMQSASTAAAISSAYETASTS